jgi:uncharacterized protein (UPF0216 family)
MAVSSILFLLIILYTWLRPNIFYTGIKTVQVVFDEGSFKRLIGVMNRHLPAQRRTLAGLLEEDSPSYVGKDGNTYDIDRIELELIASFLDENEVKRLRIPIYISTDLSYPGGAWKVEGMIEVKVISRIIGRRPDRSDMLRLFHPHIREVRRKLPDSTTVLYLP